MDTNQIISWLMFNKIFIIPIITAIAGVWFGALLKSGFPYMLANLLGGWCPGAKELRGTWRTKFTYNTSTEIKEDNPTIKVRQFANWITGKGSSSTDKASYVSRAKRKETSVLIGDWDETHPKGAYYYGAFQLNISPATTRMEGQWLGMNHDRKVMNGSWKWEKQSS